LGTLVVVGVACLGIDRIDFFGGKGPFTLTPFVTVAPFVALGVIWAWSRTHRSPLRFPSDRRSALVGVVLVSVFLVFVIISNVNAGAIKSLSRSAQLVIVAFGAWGLIYICAKIRSWGALRLGAVIGLALFVLFDVMQAVTYVHHGSTQIQILDVINGRVVPYGAHLFRLSGVTIDPNRAGLILAVGLYAFAYADSWAERSWPRWVAALITALAFAMAALTLSRTGAVAIIFVIVGIAPLLWRAAGKALRIALVSVSAMIVVIGLGALLIVLKGYSGAGTSRLSLDSGSGAQHFELIGRGFELLKSASLVEFLFGRGYGTSYLFLSDIFPGNEHGNLHSAYVTAAVECGVLGALVLALITLLPAFGKHAWLAFALLWFGVFYQALADPTYWFAIALIWQFAGAPRWLTLFGARHVIGRHSTA
jgi:hypothetical protein